MRDLYVQKCQIIELTTGSDTIAYVVLWDLVECISAVPCVTGCRDWDQMWQSYMWKQRWKVMKSTNSKPMKPQNNQFLCLLCDYKLMMKTQVWGVYTNDDPQLWGSDWLCGSYWGLNKLDVNQLAFHSCTFPITEKRYIVHLPWIISTVEPFHPLIPNYKPAPLWWHHSRFVPTDCPLFIIEAQFPTT